MPVTLVNEVVSDTEAKDHVFKDAAATRTQDEFDALNRVINGVSAAIEGHIRGPVRRRTFTGEKYDGGGEWLFLKNRPIVSVTSVTEDGTVLTEDTHFYVYPESGLRKAEGTAAGLFDDPGEGPQWKNKPRSNVVTYVAGLAATVADVPWDIKLAALQWIFETWTTQPANLATVMTEGGGFISPSPMPPQVREKLKPFVQPVVGVA